MSKIQNQAWPDDVDGDVFRRMKSSGFDFDAKVDIDFNVDFDDWPPSSELIELLGKQFSTVKMYEPDEHGNGYIQIVLNELVTYELVMYIQSSVSELAAPFGGICESWGVLH